MDDVPKPPSAGAGQKPFFGPRGRYIAGGLLVLLLVALVLFEKLASGIGPLKDLLSFKTLGLHYAALKQLVDQHFALAGLCFVIGYGLLGLFLLPGSTVFVVASGLLFGAVTGIPLAVVGATLAAALGFATGRFLLSGAADRLAHQAVATLKAGFERHGLSYMMFLRLTPGMPFAVINAVPALLGVRFSTFLIGTIVGLLPSRIALSTAGAGLGRAIAIENEKYNQCVAGNAAAEAGCSYDIHASSLLTVETIAAFFALGLVALTPVILDYASRLRRR